MYEFTIEKPNKIKILHYTGIGSKYDPETYMGFEDQSIKDLCTFFNSFGYNLTGSQIKIYFDFAFLPF
jgi:hypothetical protein